MNLLKALATISSLTLVSRILAFVRDVLIARIFGAGMATDAFFVAFRLPNLLRRLFAEGAFSQAFVPIFGEYKNRRGHEETQLLVDHVTTMLAIILFVVTLVGIIAAPVMVYISAPGFVKDAEKFDLTVQLLRITSPYIFFISLVAVAAGILNTYNKFWVPAVRAHPAQYLFHRRRAVAGAVFRPAHPGAGLGGVHRGLCATGVPGPVPEKDRHAAEHPLQPGTMRACGASSGRWGRRCSACPSRRSACIINTIFASFLVAGSVSWLYYADRLMEFPSGMLGVALGSILLPSLSKCHADNNTGGIFQAAGLGLAPDHHADAARSTRIGHDRRAAAGDLLPARRVRRARRADDQPRADRLQHRPDRHHPGEDARARFLCEAGHQDPGQDRHRHACWRPRR